MRKELLLELSQELFPVFPAIYHPETQEKLLKVISAYSVKRFDLEANHRDLRDKIRMFLSGKQLEGIAPKTIDSYERQLRIFAKHVYKSTANITTEDIRSYLAKFSHQKTGTISTKISILKSFFGWLTAEEIIQRDPTTKIKNPKREKRFPKALSIEELEMLREACETNRQRALVETLYSSGCRLSELQSLNRDSIDFSTRTARVIGKGNKEGDVFFSVKAIYHIRKYLMNRLDDCEALFVTERKPYRRLSTRGIQREISIIAAKAGIQKQISPHTLRHTLANLMLNNGADLATVQAILRHENPATTQIYAQVSAERKREQYEKHLVI